MGGKAVLLLLQLAGFVTLVRSGYILTFPWMLTSGATHQFCMAFHNTTSDIEVKLNFRFLSEQKDITTKLFKHGVGSCFDVEIPLRVKKMTTLKVEGKAVGEGEDGYTFSGKHRLQISQDLLVILVQSDKPIYKPGETVKFRVLAFTWDLKAWSGVIKKIIITDPKNTRIGQWLNVQTNGLVSLQKTLSKEPILGDWSITVKINNQKQRSNFKVFKYVIPKFEVIINPPSYLLINSKTVDVEICAKYTYQKEVIGNVNGSVCIKGTYETQNQRPCYNFNEKLHGCHKISVDSNELQLANKSYTAWYLNLKVNATVTEIGTGVQITKSHEGPSIEKDRLFIQPDLYTREYFKPGIPFEAKISVKSPDKKPLAGENFHVVANDDLHSPTVKYAGNYTTDEDGYLNIIVPPLPTNIQRLSMEIIPETSKERDPVEIQDSDVYFLDYTSGSFSMRQWYSPSQSFVWIKSIYKKIMCKESVDAVFYYNVEENQENFKIFYHILSRGKIISTGEWFHKDSVETEIEVSEGMLIEQPIPTDATAESTTEMPADTTSTPVTVPVVFDEIHEDQKKLSLLKKMKDMKKEEKSPETLIETIQTVELNAKEVTMTDVPKKIYKQSLRIESDWGPEASLIVYYIRPDGETVADSISIPIQNCFKNKVNMTFNKNNVKPGSNTKMTIGATPFSLCAIGMVDKSVHLLGGNNQITPDKIFENLKHYKLQPASHLFSDREHCQNYSPFPPPGMPPAEIPPLPIESPGMPPAVPNSIDSAESKEEEKTDTDSENVVAREKRSYYLDSYSSYFDSSEAFKTVGLAVVTDLRIITRPCEYNERPMFLPIAYIEPVKMKRKLRLYESNTEDVEIEPVRSYFPETWLWDLQSVGPDGKLVMAEKVPDTITTWVGNTICTNNETGIGVSEPASLTVFKPFFVSYTFPYAAVRGEKLPLKVSVFNFLTTCINVKITLAKSKSYLITERPTKTNICICGSKSHTVIYTVIPLQLGSIDINVTAKSNNNNEECGPKLVKKNLVTDIISKKLIVNAEGVSKEYTYNSYTCMKKNEQAKHEKVSLELPKLHFVSDSQRGYVSVIGDLMGPTLSGLENLVQMPYGCGEQNMVGFVPNIYVLDYLKSSKRNESGLMDLAVSYMEQGYQRQLQYQHKDSTFSAFGETDEVGSTWLTAFVLRSFAKADQYIFIDSNIMTRIINWFVLNLRENDCFHEFGHVWSKHIKGGLDGGNEDVALTAYVLISFLEINIPNKSVIKDAMKCLTNADVDDTYTLALMNYAFALYGVESEKRTAVREKLMSRAIEHDDLMYWTRDNKKIEPKEEKESWLKYNQAPSAEVEITSYVLLAMLTEDASKVISKSLPIIQWLTKQRNAYGGFASTQDTVLALQALSKYAGYIYKDGLDLNIKISGKQLMVKFAVDDMNSLTLQTADIKMLPNEVNVTTKGVGCALIQMNVKYNMYEVDAKTAPLHMTIIPEYLNACDRARLVVKAGHNDVEGSTNMAVAEIKLPTGWIAHTESVHELVRVKTGQIRRAEIQNDGTQVNVYFDKLTVVSEVFAFNILQTLGLKETKPAVAILYDYYEKPIRTAANYTVKTRCGVHNPGSDIVEDLGKEEILQDDASAKKIKHKLKTCPVCYTSISANFTKLFCNAPAAYKIDILKAQSRVKVQIDEKQESQKPIDINTKVYMPIHCKCDVMKSPDTQVLVLTKRKFFKDEERKLHLNRWASIFPLDTRIKELVEQKHSLCEKAL